MNVRDLCWQDILGHFGGGWNQVQAKLLKWESNGLAPGQCFGPHHSLDCLRMPL